MINYFNKKYDINISIVDEIEEKNLIVLSDKYTFIMASAVLSIEELKQEFESYKAMVDVAWRLNKEDKTAIPYKKNSVEEILVNMIETLEDIPTYPEIDLIEEGTVQNINFITYTDPILMYKER